MGVCVWGAVYVFPLSLWTLEWSDPFEFCHFSKPRGRSPALAYEILEGTRVSSWNLCEPKGIFPLPLVTNHNLLFNQYQPCPEMKFDLMGG